MSYKVGQVLYSVSYDTEKSKFYSEEWHVRTIRGGQVTAIMKDEFTWVKLSKTHGDWGWAKSIPPLWRETWAEGTTPGRGIAPTRLGAWKAVRKELARGWILDEGPELEKALATADRMISGNSHSTKRHGS